MPFLTDLDQSLEKTQFKLKEISIGLERLDREMHQIFSELEVDPKQLPTEHSYHLPSSFWKGIQEDRKRLDNKLALALKNIKDPLKSKKTFSERGMVKPHWLFVR